MSTVKMCRISSIDSKNTEKIGENLGRNLRGGEIIELVSDLGGGKTTLVRGLAKGAGSKDTVASPSFTISREYIAAKFTIHHFDFYRLSEPGLVQYELSDKLGDPKIVVVAEWADVVQGVLPKKRLVIKITKTSNVGREIKFKYSPSLDYLVVGLC
ncbi:MAG: tRNA (adenosine(37)-N6)-threonylcarbamoyltransferase complex ATPase subunit type 1 TsaE [Patescibacteria group bacterium]